MTMLNNDYTPAANLNWFNSQPADEQAEMKEAAQQAGQSLPDYLDTLLWYDCQDTKED